VTDGFLQLVLTQKLFAIPREQVVQVLGPAEWRRVSVSEAAEFAVSLESLMAGIVEREN
jgi:hypothetical protein